MPPVTSRLCLDNLAPDHTGPQHNEYKGFYRVMRRRIVRKVEPVVHVSVKRQWEDDEVSYRSPALRGVLENVGVNWGKIRVIAN